MTEYSIVIQSLLDKILAMQKLVEQGLATEEIKSEEYIELANEFFDEIIELEDLPTGFFWSSVALYNFKLPIQPQDIRRFDQYADRYRAFTCNQADSNSRLSH